jgi:hypothetical protein
MSEWKQGDEIICLCHECNAKIIIKTENTVKITRPSLDAKETKLEGGLKNE